EFRRGGYIHPVKTPSGRIVTDDYPAKHIHHHGLWWAWTRTSFEGRAPDFWNMGEGKGRVDFVALDGVESGPVFAALRSRQVFTDLLSVPPTKAIEETWQVHAYSTPGEKAFFVFDLESEQRCAGGSALKLPQYYYGVFGYRCPSAWEGETNMLYLDSNGVTNRITANETHARWYWAGGP